MAERRAASEGSGLSASTASAAASRRARSRAVSSAAGAVTSAAADRSRTRPLSVMSARAALVVSEAPKPTTAMRPTAPGRRGGIGALGMTDGIAFRGALAEAVGGPCSAICCKNSWQGPRSCSSSDASCVETTRCVQPWSGCSPKGLRRSSGVAHARGLLDADRDDPAGAGSAGRRRGPSASASLSFLLM